MVLRHLLFFPLIAIPLFFKKESVDSSKRLPESSSIAMMARLSAKAMIGHRKSASAMVVPSVESARVSSSFFYLLCSAGVQSRTTRSFGVARSRSLDIGD